MLVSSGMEAEAIGLARKAAARGSLAARVRLARFGESAGISHEEADRIIDQAEVDIEDHDATAHWALWGAYDLLLGSCEYEERSRRALAHLEAFARETGDLTAVIAMARNYLQGRIGVQADIELAVDWYYCAEALGHPEASRELKRALDAFEGTSTSGLRPLAAAPHVKRLGVTDAITPNSSSA
jgi:TPR repeat protein